MAKRILVWTGAGEASLCDALARIEGVRVQRASDRADALSALGEADGYVTSTVIWDEQFARRLARTARLGWIQLLNAGFDSMERLGVPERVTVTTVGDIGARVVAEHATALLLALLRALPVAAAEQSREQWDSTGVVQATRTLYDLDVGIVGFGHIGQAFAALAQAFGARVTAFARTARTGPGGIEVRPLDAFRASLPALEAIVVCAPLNGGTERLIDAPACASMRRGTYLVNVSRGGIVDTDALVAALASGILAGAALDVVSPEPLPKAHPLWSLPNVLITPHTAWAGAGATQARRLRELIVENAGRFARGETLRNVASIRRG
jgi:phosphoglycerate dehydrogenase-like enzyme